MRDLPDAAVTAAAAWLHDEECDTDGGTTTTCGRWVAGSDPQSPYHAHHVGHVEFYRRRAAGLLAAAMPHLTAAAEPGLVLRGDEVHRALDAARAEGAACEREDCALLAEQHNARYLVRSEDFADGYPSGLEPFADLIRARRVVTAVTAVTAAAGRQS